MEQRHSLPIQPTTLIGRQSDLEFLLHKLRDKAVRLLSLTGAPGVGKSRLALAIAWEALDDFPDGASFVDLSPITDASLVVSTIAQQLGVRPTGEHQPLQDLRNYLEDRHLLLLLDNFEQVLGAGPQVAELLAYCPHLKVMVTSREALRLRWEHVFPVAPLPVPDPKHLPGLEDLAANPAMSLFIQRASAVNPGFALSQPNAAELAEICVRLEGIPLAIELAAAQTDVLPPHNILDGLKQHCLDALQSGPEDLPRRQRTLRDAIGWSYSLLSVEERQAFRKMAIFAGGATLETVRTVYDDAGDWIAAAPEHVGALVRKNLLRMEIVKEEQRVSLLEMLRQYGLDQLSQAGELETARERHAAYFLGLAEEAELRLMGPHGQFWLSRLDREHDNLRAALQALKNQGEVEKGLRLGGALWQFWRARGQYLEGRTQLEALLAIPVELLTTAARAKALVAAGEMARYVADYPAALAHHEAGVRLYRELGDDRGTAGALLHLALSAVFDGKVAMGSTLAQESLSLSKELEDRRGIALALFVLADLACFTDDFPRAVELATQSVDLSRTLDDSSAVAPPLGCLAISQFHLGDHAAAYRNCLESLKIGVEQSDRYRIAWACHTLAVMAAFLDRPTRAARLAGASAHLLEEISSPLPVLLNTSIQTRLERARKALGERGYSIAFQQGYSMPLDQAIDYAIEKGGEKSGVATPTSECAEALHSSNLVELTRREREVAELVAQGYTNQQIATELVISERTAETHISNILSKLSLTSRTQIALWFTTKA